MAYVEQYIKLKGNHFSPKFGKSIVLKINIETKKTF